MRRVKIFIGSSIVEFEKERVSLVNFLYKLRNQLGDFGIDHFVCEEADPKMSIERKQDEFNKEIDDSDICLFLFHKKVGAYTLEELDYAFKLYNESEEGNKRPRICIFFKKPDTSESIDSSIEELKRKLDDQGLCYFTFDSIDTVKLRILLSLKFQEIKGMDDDITEDKHLRMNDRPMEDINMNNGDLRALEDEYRKVEDKYLDMLPEYTKGGCPDEFYKEFAETDSKRKLLDEQIEELKSQIFNLSLSMSKDDVG